MADDRDESQQTEQPTQKRLDEARAHGDIVKSPEVSAFVLLLGGAMAIMMFGASTAKSLTGAMRMFLEQPDQIGVSTSSDIMALMRQVTTTLGTILAPIFAVMIIAALAGHVLQARPSITLEKIKPDFSKLNIFAGLKRMFGVEGLMNLVKGLLKMGVVGFAVWTQIWPERTMLQSVLDQSAFAVAGDMGHLLYKVLYAALAALAAIAAADYILQRYRFAKRNKMSRQEIKEEYRQNEGDPQIKAKIRQIRIERAQEAHDRGGAGSDGHHHQSDALRRRAEIRAGQDGGADLRGEGHRRAGAQDPRSGERAQRSDRGEPAARPRAARHRRGRRGRAAGALQGRGAGDRLCLSPHRQDQGAAVAKRSSAATMLSRMPGVRISWPASCTMRSSLPGQARDNSQAVSIGEPRSRRPWISTPGMPASSWRPGSARLPPARRRDGNNA
ncbi:MAG: EscU/YscU/HrcU family type III secretion system export apparatus switch protein [Rhizomicrobium sp.]